LNINQLRCKDIAGTGAAQEEECPFIAVR